MTKDSYHFRGPEQAPGSGGQYQHVALHAGLVCLNADDMDRSLQLELFETVLDFLAGEGEFINQIIEVSVNDYDSEEIEIIRYVLPLEPLLLTLFDTIVTAVRLPRGQRGDCCSCCSIQRSNTHETHFLSRAIILRKIRLFDARRSEPQGCLTISSRTGGPLKSARASATANPSITCPKAR